MTCTPVKLESGGFAIVCGPRQMPKRCACGNIGTQLCDWKIPDKKSGTCDKPICNECTTKPAPNKDICPDHADDLARWRANHEGPM